MKTKKQKRDEAVERQVKYDKLTIAEKIVKAKVGSREYRRLIKQKERQ